MLLARFSSEHFLSEQHRQDCLCHVSSQEKPSTKSIVAVPDWLDGDFNLNLRPLSKGRLNIDLAS
jgi:hypothetical protein